MLSKFQNKGFCFVYKNKRNRRRMTASRPSPVEFRARFAAGEQLVGTFIKTPTSHGIEILGDLGYDFVVIDEEHAPFDRVSIDIGILAARAS